MKIPANILYILEHALDEADHTFNDALEDFDDYTDEDIEAQAESQRQAREWLASLEVEA